MKDWTKRDIACDRLPDGQWRARLKFPQAGDPVGVYGQGRSMHAAGNDLLAKLAQLVAATG